MKSFLLALSCCLAVLSTFAQGNMIYGKKHLITLETPKDWVQTPHDKLPYMIVPADTKGQPAAYMYVFGLDYAAAPDVEVWMKANTEAFANAVKGAQVVPLTQQFDISSEGYTTGRYQGVTYEYPNKKKEVLLAIECKGTIVTVVCSVIDGAQFEKYYPSFTSIVNSLQIAEAAVSTTEVE